MGLDSINLTRKSTAKQKKKKKKDRRRTQYSGHTVKYRMRVYRNVCQMMCVLYYIIHVRSDTRFRGFSFNHRAMGSGAVTGVKLIDNASLV